MNRALLTAGVNWLNFKAWWKDAVVERVQWLLSDIRPDRTTNWNGPTDEWLAKPRMKIGSSR